MKHLVNLIFDAALFFLLVGCSPISNSIVGFTPKNPESTQKDDFKTKGYESTSLANHDSLSIAGLKISSSLGDKNSGQLKASESGKYKVVISVQGELATVNK